MVEYVGPASPSRRRSVDLGGVGTLLRRLDWVMLLAVGCLVAYGLWAISGVTRFDIPGDPDYYVWRQAIAAGRGRRRAGDRGRRPADAARARLAGVVRRNGRVDGAGLRPRRGRARLQAVDRRRPVPVPAVGVREGALRAGARRVPGRAGAPDRLVVDRRRRDRPRPRAAAARLPAARPRHGDGVRGRAGCGPVRRRHALADAGRARVRRGVRPARRPVAASRPRASTSSSPTSASASSASPTRTRIRAA